MKLKNNFEKGSRLSGKGFEKIYYQNFLVNISHLDAEFYENERNLQHESSVKILNNLSNSIQILDE